MLVPLTFPTPLHLSGQPLSSHINATDQNLIDEPTSKLTAWRINTTSGSLGIAVGGSFGSVYLFGTPPSSEPVPKSTPQSLSRTTCPTPTTSTALSGPRPLSPPSSPKSPSHSRRNSRSLQSPSSLSLNQALIKSSARSRVVSGVSREQVQAPRNFVDFEDEPERLKDLLKNSTANRHPRERSIVDALLPTFEKGLVIERPTPLPSSPFLTSQNLSPVSPGSSGGRDNPKSLLSATNSPLFTPRSLSAPPSPHIGVLNSKTDEDTISLIAHLFPPRSGAGHGIADLVSLEGTGLLLSLQESGDLTVFDTRDGVCVATARCRNAPSSCNDTSRWTRLRTVQIEEKVYLILACASYRPPYPDIFGLPDTADDNTNKSAYYSLFELHVGGDYSVHPTSLEPLGAWEVEGHAEASELLRNEIDGSLSFIYVNSEDHIISRPMSIIASFEVPARARSLTSTSANSNDDSKALSIPNPFKSIGSKSSDNVASQASSEETAPDRLAPNTDFSRVRFGEERDVGSIGFSISPCAIGGLCSRHILEDDKVLGLAWTDSEVLVFHFQTDGKAFPHFFTQFQPEDIGKIWNVQLIDNKTFVVLGKSARCYKLTSVDANGDPNDSEDARLQPVPMHTTALATPTAGSVISNTNELVTLRRTSSGRKEISLVSSLESRDGTHRRLWRSEHPTSPRPESEPTLTSVLPLELNLLIFGYSDGRVRNTSFSALAQTHCPKSPIDSPSSAPGPSIESALFQRTSDTPIPASICSLHLVRNERTGDRFIIGGSDDGGIAVWTLQDLKLCARFVQFIVPLQHVIQVRQQEENAGPLRGCALCISADGTIAAIAVDGFELLYVLPGSSSPLLSIRYGGGEDHDLLVVLYADGSARLWDVRTGEFRRAMDTEKAKDALGNSGWLEISIDGRDTQLSTIISTLPSVSAGADSICTFTIALERFLKVTAVDAKASGNTPVSSMTNSSPLTHLRTLLSIMLTPGLSADIDEICEMKLGVVSNAAGVGHSSNQATTIYNYRNSRSAWCISGVVSASRAIAIIAILKTMSLYDEISDDCQTVIMFYATSLPSAVGPWFNAPDVVYLARLWLDATNELRNAARILFDAGITRLSDEESAAMVDAWQHHLPCLQPTAEQYSKQSGLALFLCGYMAIEKYSLLSTSALVDISKSVALYLNDDGSGHRSLAIDLCAKGFHIWQHYVDAMALLRSLCAIATNMRKETITVQNVGPQARLAVLQIASNNTPLFMTVLTLDILNPKTLEHRKSVMQLVAFLIRKRPLILYPNLPRLMEAVVKSLDPNSTASRDAVLDTATEIIGHVVKTFPTVDFHTPTQRLAVGTTEGAFIMYDLKTATQLYVLEGHKKRPTACSFSPDGRRLVTVSLEEGVVLVWKVGSSITSLFHPGAPPRQGHSGSHPYKTFPFNVGEEANMTIAGTLEWVRFEWASDRSVRLRIRESTLSFSA